MDSITASTARADPDTFSALLQQHARIVSKVAGTYAWHADDRDDLAQEIAVQLSNVTGAPWWVLWVLVVIAIAGLSPPHVGEHTPQWIRIGLGLGVVGTLGTWLWSAWAVRRPDALRATLGDGADGIRRSLLAFDDLERFERE